MVENLGDKAAVVLLEADDCESVAGLLDNPRLEGATGNAASDWTANADDRFFL